MSPAAPASSTLYNDAAKLKNYDIVFLPCEGSPRDKAANADQNLVDYTAIGRRVFTTHFRSANVAAVGEYAEANGIDLGRPV